MTPWASISASNLVLLNAVAGKGIQRFEQLPHPSLSNKMRAPPDVYGLTTADIQYCIMIYSTVHVYSTSSSYLSRCNIPKAQMLDLFLKQS
jgi:hypothetical protein